MRFPPVSTVSYIRDAITEITRAYQRVASTESWAKHNPVLEEGEIGVEISGTVVKVKVGNGVDKWADLTYVSYSSTTGGGVPTGTGFRHITSGAEDATARYPTKTEVGLGNVDNTSDANKPVSTAQAEANTADRARANHTGTQLAATISDFSAAADARIAAQRGVASGLASLDASGLVPTNQLPALAITKTSAVASEAAQLALVAQEGDVAVRSDLNKSYIHNGGTAGTMADWQELLTPTDAVLSVAGRTGAVVLAKADVGLSNVDNTSDLAKPISTATQTALDAKLDDSQASAFGLSLLDDADIAAARVTLGNTRKTLSAALSTTVTSATLITDGTTPWQQAVVAGKSYKINVIGTYQTADVNCGARLTIAGAGGVVGTISGRAWMAYAQLNSANVVESTIYAISGGGSYVQSPSVAVINSPHHLGMEVVFHCTTSGSLAFYFATEVAGTAAQINADSTLLFEEIT